MALVATCHSQLGSCLVCLFWASRDSLLLCQCSLNEYLDQVHPCKHARLLPTQDLSYHVQPDRYKGYTGYTGYTGYKPQDLSYNRTIMGLRAVNPIPAQLDSTSLVLAVGLDFLAEDFNYCTPSSASSPPASPWPWL